MKPDSNFLTATFVMTKRNRFPSHYSTNVFGVVFFAFMLKTPCSECKTDDFHHTQTMTGTQLFSFESIIVHSCQSVRLVTHLDDDTKKAHVTQTTSAIAARIRKTATRSQRINVSLFGKK